MPKSYTLEQFKNSILSGLIELNTDAKGNVDTDAVQKQAMAMLQTGDGEVVPVVDASGEPVEISEIVLMTTGGGEPEEAPEEGEAAASEAAIERAVNAAVKKALGRLKPPRQADDRRSPEAKYTLPANVIRSNVRNFTGTSAEREYKAFTLGSFIKAQIGDEQSNEWLKNRVGVNVKAQSTTSNNLGGALIPEMLAADLIRLVEEYGVARSNATVYQMTSDTLLVPRQTDGVTGEWVGESTSSTEDETEFSNVQLVAKKRKTLTRMPSELVEDAVINVGDLTARNIALDFAKAEDDAAFNGDGTSTYGGIVGVLNFAGSASIATAAAGNTAFSTLDLVDFHEVTGLLPEYAHQAGNARWYMSRAGFANGIERLLAAGGGNTWTDLANGKRDPMALGFSVAMTQVLNATLTAQTSTNLLCFGDLSLGMAFGDRRQIRIDTSTERYFDQDQIAIRGTERVDIACHTFDSTTTAGPMIVLATPGA